MKQAGIAVVLAIFLGGMVYGDENLISEDKFRLLTLEQQVRLLLCEWKDEFYLTGLSRLYGRHYPILLENTETVKQILLKYFEEINIPIQYTTEDRTFEILEQLIFGTFLYSWTAEERMKLAELCKEKIDWYLKTYKVVDFTILRFDARIRGFNLEWGGIGLYVFLPEITIERLFEKYSGMGYDGLRLPSSEHLIRQYLAAWKYTRSRNSMAIRRQEEIIIKGGETMKPAILKCFKETKIPRGLEGMDRTYWRLFSLIFEHGAFRDLWTREERMELAELYHEKIDWYLRTYNVSDFVPQNFRSIIQALLHEGKIVFDEY
jgi:hypothetical protein